MPWPPAKPWRAAPGRLPWCWLAAALLLLLWTPASWAAQPAGPLPVVLSEGTAPLQAEGLAQAWVDDRGTAVLDEVVQGAARFRPMAAGTIHRLGTGSALWLKFRLMRPGDQQHWVMAFANPVLDHVTLYQQDATGRWHGAAAGDTVAVNAWPEPGRYAAFRLELPAGQARDVYVQVRSVTATSVPVRLASEVDHAQRGQLESLALGVALGALLLLIAVCVAQAWAYRDAVYGWYAAYAAVNVLMVMAYTGIGAHLLWPGSGFWADASQGTLACIAAGSALLFVRNLTGIAARHRLLDRAVRIGGWAGVAAAAIYLVAPRPGGLVLMAGYVLCASATNLRVAWLSWRRQDRVGLWVLAAYLPLTLGVVLTLLRMSGALPHSFVTHYALVLGMALEVPLLLVALAIRSRERHGAEIREQALSSHDALTGLLAPHLFHDRLHQVVARGKRDREAAAVVFIDLVNHARIKAVFGSAVAEQSLLRSVIKLRKLVREVDTVGRIGEARFGLIMEGVDARAVVTDRAARLIAAGLIPLRGLKPEVTLQFHIAGVLLGERLEEAGELAHSLDALLAAMSPRTRRPIRYLEPKVSVPVPLEADSGSVPATADCELPVEHAAAVNG